MHRGEAKVLELDANVVHAKTLGDGCVNIQGFAGYAAALVGFEHTEGAHVVKVVGELDQDDADVFRHRHRHLLEVFGLGLGARLEFDLRQLGHAVDQFRHGIAELRAERVLTDAGVFDDIVQHRRHQALVVHVHVGEDAGNGEGMRDVGFAGAPALAGMRLFGVEVGPADQIDLVFGEIAAERFAQHVDSLAARSVGALRENAVLVHLVLPLRNCQHGRLRRRYSRGSSMISTTAVAAAFSSSWTSASTRWISTRSMRPSAISRSASTVGLSPSSGTSGSLPPTASWRARLLATMTSSKRLSTLSRQSSTVMRAMLYS